MKDLVGRLIRIGGFMGKEIREIGRQPRLLLSLLLGPFLILLLFGAGYVGTSLRLRAIIVIPNDPAFTAHQAALRDQFAKGIDLVDITTDLAAAQARLRAGTVDAVIAVPADAAEQIGAGAQAHVQVFYNQIDPVGASQIIIGTVNYTNDLNKETIARAFSQGQSQAVSVEDALQRLDTALGSVDESIQRGDAPQAQDQALQARTASDLITLSAGLLLQLLQTPALGGPAGTVQRQNLAQAGQSVNSLNADVTALQQELATAVPDPIRVHQRTEAVRADVRTLQGLTAQFRQMNPYVLAAPFFGEAQNLAGKPTFVNFYTPGVIALLLQHIAVTLGALSMVRERMRGATELFRVAPITSGEILIGKYLGFLGFLAVLTAALVALAVAGLGVPLLGDYGWLALALLLLIFAALGLGFGLSMVSRTESQAVQLAMLTLLTSVFFGGFFLPLTNFDPMVRSLCYALPVTHGIIALQDVMLRGQVPADFYFWMPAILGTIFAAFSMWRFSREFRQG